MTLEVDIENSVVKQARNYGWLVHKLKWQDARGAPDRVFLGHGRCVFIEFKRPGNRIKGQQKRMFERISSAYEHCHVCDSYSQACAVLEIPE